MNIEHYNRLRNVQSLPIQHNYAIMGGRNEEHIDRVLNIKAFVEPIKSDKVRSEIEKQIERLKEKLNQI